MYWQFDLYTCMCVGTSTWLYSLWVVLQDTQCYDRACAQSTWQNVPTQGAAVRLWGVLQEVLQEVPSSAPHQGTHRSAIVNILVAMLTAQLYALCLPQLRDLVLVTYLHVTSSFSFTVLPSIAFLCYHCLGWCVGLSLVYPAKSPTRVCENFSVNFSSD